MLKKFFDEIVRSIRAYSNSADAEDVMINVVAYLIAVRRAGEQALLSVDSYEEFVELVRKRFDNLPLISVNSHGLSLSIDVALPEPYSDEEIVYGLLRWFGGGFFGKSHADESIADEVSILTNTWLREKANPDTVTSWAVNYSISPAVYLAMKGARVDLIPFVQTEIIRIFEFMLSEKVRVTDVHDASKNAGLCIPPLGLKMDSFFTGSSRYLRSESYCLDQAMSVVNGPLAGFVPQGFLFRTTGEELQLKREMITQNRLVSVVLLPSGMVRGASILTAVLLFNAKEDPAQEVLMVDLSQQKLNPMTLNDVVSALIDHDTHRLKDKAAFVSVEQIVEANFNLDPKRYVMNSDQKRFVDFIEVNKNRCVPLDEICEIVRAQMIRDSGEFEIREVNVSDINPIGIVESPKLVRVVGDPTYDPRGKVAKQLLQPGDILFAIKGSVARIGLIDDTEHEYPWVAGQSFVILRLKENPYVKNTVYLFRYLKSDLVQDAIKRLASGQVIQSIKTDDLRKFMVLIPDSTEMEELSESQHRQQLCLYAEIKRKEQEMMALKNDQWLSVI